MDLEQNDKDSLSKGNENNVNEMLDQQNKNIGQGKITEANCKKVGDYLICLSHKLGSGKFGTVFLAKDLNDSSQLLAVKIIEKSSLQHTYQINALVREINIMKSLKSPNIIALKQVKQTRNRLYIFQEKADQTLQNYLRNLPGQRLQQKHAVQFLRQILIGLYQLIKNGIIHRDLKPGNILIKQNTLKIADFGLSRQNNMVALKTVVGSPLYMAPQLLLSVQNKYQYCLYSYKCDIWSFGVICYELVTGTFPWISNKIIKDKNELLQAIKINSTSEIFYPQQLQISQSYKDLVKGCLRFYQDQRYDWNQIYGHSLFQGYFQNLYNTNMMQEQNYTLTQFRMKVHASNINLINFFQKMPDQFDLKEFICIMKALDQLITQKQAQHLFNNFSKFSHKILSKDLLIQLQKHDIQMKNLKGLQFKQQEQQKKKLNSEIRNIFKSLKNVIHEEYIDLYYLFKQFGQSHSEYINKQEFVELLMKFNRKQTKQSKKKKQKQYEILFHYFNEYNNQSIKLSSFYEQFCKAVQIPAIKQENISRQLYFLANKKKK